MPKMLQITLVWTITYIKIGIPGRRVVAEKMLKFFRERISSNDAAILYLNSLIKVIENQCDADSVAVEEFMSNFKGIDYKIDNMNVFNFEIMLAVVSLEFQVVRNLIPKKYVSLHDSLFRNLEQFTQYDEAREYAYNTIQSEYMPEIEKVLREKLPPTEGVLTLLLYKLDIDFDPLIATLFIEILTNKIGCWKHIINNFNIK